MREIERVYLDYNATAPILAEVKTAVLEAWEKFGNSSSLYVAGREARELVEAARGKVTRLIGAERAEIIFTSGGSEGNNMVLNSFRGRQVAASAIEHPSVLRVGERMGAKIIGVDEVGHIRFDELEKILRGGVDLVSVMLVNNEVGARQDIRRIAEMAHGAGALCHTDVVQAVGRIPVDVRELGVDFLTLSGHKIGGLKGCGVLFVRGGVAIEPLILGGEQERGLRAGTENVLGIVALGEAADRALGNLPKFLGVEKLKERLLNGILTEVDQVVVNGAPTDSPNTLNVSFLGAEGESIMLMLDEAGVEVSTGSACAARSIEPSHVIMAMGGNAELAHGSVRFSLGLETTRDEVDYVIKTLPPIIKKLRAMSARRI